LNTDELDGKVHETLTTVHGNKTVEQCVKITISMKKTQCIDMSHRHCQGT